MPEALVQIQTPTARTRLPAWLRKGRRHSESVAGIQRDLRRLKLHTVCESARCPNLNECFHRGTATFLILGGLCTRRCGFCSIPRGVPGRDLFTLDPDEPRRVAGMAASLGLDYVVLTSVNRDDLPDGGSAHFAATVREVRRALPSARVEVLTPDFQGDLDAVAGVLDAAPDVFNHNLETVPRLYRRVRPQARYARSLEVLAFAKRMRPQALTKSGLMLGLGERQEEVQAVLEDLRAASVELVTLGQYLQPTRRSLPVVEYVPPARFDGLRDFGMSLGFRAVFSGPFVRSSYRAEELCSTD